MFEVPYSGEIEAGSWRYRMSLAPCGWFGVFEYVGWYICWGSLEGLAKLLK